MRIVARLLLLSLALLTLRAAAARTAARTAATANEHARATGRDYVRLGDWARANEFAVRWVDRDRTLQLSNRSAQLVFNADPHSDSRKATINGVTVWLALPLLDQNSNARISQLDLEKTLAPVLTPPANRAGAKVRTICLDPGHGGTDPGFLVGAQQEKKYTLLLAQEVRDRLQRAGFDVVLTRSTDIKVPLESRPAYARQRAADLFVSLHFNAIEEARNEVRGVEIFCCTPAGATTTNARGEGDTGWAAGNRNDEKNFLLAYQMQKSFVKSLQVQDRGVKRARYRVLREATMPAILIEGGFMSHPAEGKKIFDPAYRRQMAQAIVEGILSYRRIVKG
jgi:N-acetylmuramoyl-L-alanine amidase